MASVGEQLRRARTSRQMSMEDLVKLTRISRFYLEAIETDHPERLPGQFFYKAFIRKYATLVGLDSQLLLPASSSESESVSIEELRQAKFPDRNALGFGTA